MKEQEIIHQKNKEFVHEKKEGFVHEVVNPDVKHQYIEKPVTATTEVRNPIVESTTLKKEVFVQEKGLEAIDAHKLGVVGQHHNTLKPTHGDTIKGGVTTGVGNAHHNTVAGGQGVGHGVGLHEEFEPAYKEKKGFGTKIKELFTGNPEEKDTIHEQKVQH